MLDFVDKKGVLVGQGWVSDPSPHSVFTIVAILLLLVNAFGDLNLCESIKVIQNFIRRAPFFLIVSRVPTSRYTTI